MINAWLELTYCSQLIQFDDIDPELPHLRQLLGPGHTLMAELDPARHFIKRLEIIHNEQGTFDYGAILGRTLRCYLAHSEYMIFELKRRFGAATNTLSVIVLCDNEIFEGNSGCMLASVMEQAGFHE